MTLFIRKFSPVILLACLNINAYADTPFTSFKDMFANVHGVYSLIGGWSWTNTSNGNHQYVSDDDVFIYSYNNNNTHSHGVIGGFIGGEWILLCNPYLYGQLGIEYDYFSSTSLLGANLVGIEIATSTPYVFNYKVQTQQVLIAGKLLTSFWQFVHPYLSAALGAAFNRTHDFFTYTPQTGSINIAPIFGGATQTQFAYRVGVGIDTDLSTKIRFGIGYQYNNFGKATTKKGVVTFNDYNAPVPFSLSSPNLYANQLVLSLSYVG